jgi:hypothetical protein
MNCNNYAEKYNGFHFDYQFLWNLRFIREMLIFLKLNRPFFESLQNRNFIRTIVINDIFDLN